MRTCAAQILFVAAVFIMVVLGHDYSPAVAENPSHAQRLDSLFARLKLADEQEAQSIQSDILEIWNDSGSASMNLILLRAHQAMAVGMLDIALNHLDDLVRLAPDFAEGWNARATVHYYRGNYEKSLADIQATLMLESRHFGALSGLGLVFLALGDEQAALNAYRAANEVHPHLSGPKKMITILEDILVGEGI